MAKAQIEVPDSLLEKAAQAKIRALQRENKNLTGRLNTAEKRLREMNFSVSKAKTVQEAFRQFIGVLKDELDLSDEPGWSRW